MVPLYNVFCQVTGLNGKVDISQPQTTSRYKSDDGSKSTHLVMVEFDTNRNQKLACEFSPKHPALQVILGELAHTAYHVKNLSKKTITVQAIPSISPGSVAKYLKKLECFCFNQQTLKPGESAELPLRFWLEPEFPNDIHRLTLSYTLFDVTPHTKENGT
jgi:cytochrome c oxidase assembly protein subunit 11